MIKIKPIIFSASAAFVLSFVTAVCSKSGFPVSLLKAVIFALVFGAIAVGVQFVCAKFLSDGGAPSESQEETKSAGSKVDLVVSEADLPDDKEGPAFFVEGKHILSSEDVVQSKAQAASLAQASEVQRQNQALEAAEKVRERKAAENIAQKAAEISSQATASSAPSAAAEKAEAAPVKEAEAPSFTPVNLAGASAEKEPESSGSSGGDELDDLPDIGEIGGAVVGAGSSDSDDDVIEDSDFAREGAAASGRQTVFSDGKVADVKDAPVMAEAIRTILKTEE